MKNIDSRIPIRSRNFSMKEVRELREIFKGAEPFQHIGIANFLKDHVNLFSAVKREKFFKKDSDLFSFSQTNNLFYSSNPIIQSAVNLFSSQTFSSLIGAISGMKLKPGALDVFASLYEKTDYLVCHDDRIEDRKIAFIVYLSDNFTQKDGGALALYSNKGKHARKKIVAYPPAQNSLFIFQVSKVSWHEVEEVVSDKKRYAIGGWLH